MLRFQSTFPRGERRFLRGGSRLVSYFNPRSLVGNGEQRSKHLRACRNFNPRSLVGNDKCKAQMEQTAKISIHVPSWGTTPMPTVGSCFFIFQSTFPRGERRITAVKVDGIQDFNPRSLVGNDGYRGGQLF